MSDVPRKSNGQFASRYCPNPLCSGELVYEPTWPGAKPEWHCQGLVDPEDDNKPLLACGFELRYEE